MSVLAELSQLLQKISILATKVWMWLIISIPVVSVKIYTFIPSINNSNTKKFKAEKI